LHKLVLTHRQSIFGHPEPGASCSQFTCSAIPGANASTAAIVQADFRCSRPNNEKRAPFRRFPAKWTDYCRSRGQMMTSEVNWLYRVDTLGLLVTFRLSFISQNAVPHFSARLSVSKAWWYSE
jgi:hypothetical protein